MDLVEKLLGEPDIVIREFEGSITIDNGFQSHAFYSKHRVYVTFGENNRVLRVKFK